MPAPLLSREEVLERLAQEFRHSGYDGATLTRLSQATGLVKASLYHYFPKGKPDMGRAVLVYLTGFIVADVLAPLKDAADSEAGFRAMVQGLKRLYLDGRASCLIDLFTVGQSRDLFGEEIKGAVIALRDGIARAVAETGVDLATALQRAERAVALIQGSLVVARALDDPRVFLNAVDGLPAELMGRT